MVQWSADRYVIHSYNPRSSVTTMLDVLQWDTLEQRQLKAKVTIEYKIVHALVAIPSIQCVPVPIVTVEKRPSSCISKKEQTTTSTHSSQMSYPFGTNYHRIQPELRIWTSSSSDWPPASFTQHTAKQHSLFLTLLTWFYPCHLSVTFISFSSYILLPTYYHFNYSMCQLKSSIKQ